MDLITLASLVLVGLIAGVLASALGVGGGLVFVPALVALYAFDQHLAQGTSLAVILPTAVVGTIGHARQRRVVWRPAMIIGLSGAVGALLGARLALSLDDETLRRVFAVLLTILTTRMAIRSVVLTRRRFERQLDQS